MSSASEYPGTGLARPESDDPTPTEEVGLGTIDPGDADSSCRSIPRVTETATEDGTDSREDVAGRETARPDVGTPDAPRPDRAAAAGPADCRRIRRFRAHVASITTIPSIVSGAGRAAGSLKSDSIWPFAANLLKIQSLGQKDPNQTNHPTLIDREYLDRQYLDQPHGPIDRAFELIR